MSGTALAVALLFAPPFVTYTWEPASGPVSLYQIEVQVEGRAPEQYYSTGPGINLTSTFGKQIRVRARACGRGCGPWSDLSTPVTLNRNADFDGDGVVGLMDTVILGQSFGSSGPGDLTGDSVVSTADLIEFNEVYGSCTGYTLLDGRAVPAYIDCSAAR